jgi:hypothetical protein
LLCEWEYIFLRIEICRGAVIGRKDGLGHVSECKLLLPSYFN